MLNCFKKIEIKPCVYCSGYTRLKTVIVNENGVLSHKSVFAESSLNDDYSDVSGFDFNLSNLVRSNSSLLSSTVSFSNSDYVGMSDKLDNISKSLENVTISE